MPFTLNSTIFFTKFYSQQSDRRKHTHTNNIFIRTDSCNAPHSFTSSSSLWHWIVVHRNVYEYINKYEEHFLGKRRPHYLYIHLKKYIHSNTSWIKRWIDFWKGKFVWLRVFGFFNTIHTRYIFYWILPLMFCLS